MYLRAARTDATRILVGHCGAVVVERPLHGLIFPTFTSGGAPVCPRRQRCQRRRAPRPARMGRVGVASSCCFVPPPMRTAPQRSRCWVAVGLAAWGAGFAWHADGLLPRACLERNGRRVAAWQGMHALVSAVMALTLSCGHALADVRRHATRDNIVGCLVTARCKDCCNSRFAVASGLDRRSPSGLSASCRNELV